MSQHKQCLKLNVAGMLDVVKSFQRGIFLGLRMRYQLLARSYQINARWILHLSLCCIKEAAWNPNSLALAAWRF